MTVLLPVYDEPREPAQAASYYVNGFAAFTVTGLGFQRRGQAADGLQQRVITGKTWSAKATAGASSATSSSTSPWPTATNSGPVSPYGATVVELTS